jgi:ankyrin repeat protein
MIVNFFYKGINSMLLAIVNSLPKLVNFLLKNGFDIKVAAPNISYITDSAYLNEIEILKILIEAGCDVNETKQDENGVILNPLWAACERSNLGIVEILLAHGANTIIRPDLKMTSLHCTAMAQCESLAIAKLLVENKCPINMKSAQAGETPLFLASNSGFSEIVEYLLSLGKLIFIIFIMIKVVNQIKIFLDN